MSGFPEPLLWETSGFWAAIYALAALFVIARATWKRDDPDRRRILRRIVLGALALFLAWQSVLGWNAWADLEGLPRLGGRINPRDQATVATDALSASAAILAAFTLTLALAALFRRRPRSGDALPWRGLLFLAGLVVAATLLPARGRIGFFGPHFAAPGRIERAGPDWIDRAMLLGSIVAMLSGLVVFRALLAFVTARGPDAAARREELRDRLAVWGVFLFAGAVLHLIGKLISILDEVRFLGPRSPSWGDIGEVFVKGNRIALVFAFAGLAVLCFGVLQLGRREKPA